MNSTIQAIHEPANALVDPELELLIPENDAIEPELSIVIPAMNESLTIEEFVAWCHEGLERAGIVGEILIVDSSTDGTAELAVANGARVLKAPPRGLGRAYIDAIPYIRGKWIVMGDADCTYDFRELTPFVEEFRAGSEYVMGSRWKGSIEDGAMPKLHQYFGTPITTWILNRLYSSKFSDIHCGMRGITRDALVRLDLQSQSWEYASELVLKSVHMELVTTEVPVTFLKDQDGRLSHHKREGWFSPWKAAWINLKAMFIYGADFFLLKPGAILALLGLLLTLPVSWSNLDVGPVTLSLNFQFLGVTLLAVGAQAFFMGGVAQILFDYTGRKTERWLGVFRYTRTVVAAIALASLGVALAVPLAVHYIDNGLILTTANTPHNHLALTGLALLITASELFVSTLVIHGAALATEKRRKSSLRGEIA